MILTRGRNCGNALLRLWWVITSCGRVEVLMISLLAFNPGNDLRERIISVGKLYLSAAFILAGSSIVAAGFASGFLPPAVTTLLSLSIAALTGLLAAGRKICLAVRSLSRQQWLMMALQALFGTFLFRLFLNAGLKYIGSAEAGIITGTTPALTAVCAWLMLKEKISGRALTAIVLSMLGIMLVQGNPFNMNIGSFSLIGLGLILAAAACEALFTILARMFQVDENTRVEPMVQAALVCLLASAMCLPPALLENSWGLLAGLPLTVWLSLIWYGSIATVVSFAFMFAGAKRCDGYTLAAFTGLIPISSLVLAVIFLDESISLFQILGCGCVVTATLMMAVGPQGWSRAEAAD